MEQLTISISPESSERLARRAQRLRMRPEDVSREILETALREEPPTRTVREILAADGLLSEPGELGQDESDDEISLDEVRKILTVSDGPMLSDIVIEQRGPKG
ncbi:MAG: hypothetical protein ACKVVP_06215 [Chloroflexota bacterium]